ncbi:MAG: hypothetical protein SXA11_04570 [Cyanobacteriota bacterium]|nr:hypothetical protein [Cyanobacteriota bacterium]
MGQNSCIAIRLLAEVGNRQQATGNREEFLRKKERKTIFFLQLPRGLLTKECQRVAGVFSENPVSPWAKYPCKINWTSGTGETPVLRENQE